MTQNVERFIEILGEKVQARGLDVESLGILSLFDDLRNSNAATVLGLHLSSAVDQQAYIDGRSLLLYAGTIEGYPALDHAQSIARETTTYLAESTNLARAFGAPAEGFIARARTAILSGRFSRIMGAEAAHVAASFVEAANSFVSERVTVESRGPVFGVFGDDIHPRSDFRIFEAPNLSHAPSFNGVPAAGKSAADIISIAEGTRLDLYDGFSNARATMNVQELGATSPVDLAKVGELVRTGELPATSTGDFLRGRAALAVAPDLPPLTAGQIADVGAQVRSGAITPAQAGSYAAGRIVVEGVADFSTRPASEIVNLGTAARVDGVEQTRGFFRSALADLQANAINPSRGAWTAAQVAQYGKYLGRLAPAGLIGTALDAGLTGARIANIYFDPANTNRGAYIAAEVAAFAARNAGGWGGYVATAALAAGVLGLGPGATVLAGLAGAYVGSRLLEDPRGFIRDVLSTGSTALSVLENILSVQQAMAANGGSLANPLEGVRVSTDGREFTLEFNSTGTTGTGGGNGPGAALPDGMLPEVVVVQSDTSSGLTTVTTTNGSPDAGGDAGTRVQTFNNGRPVSDTTTVGGATITDGRPGLAGGVNINGWDPQNGAAQGWSLADIDVAVGGVRLLGTGIVPRAANLPLITGAEVGAIFGSTIGQFIAGNNVFAQVAAGSVLSTALMGIGSAFDSYAGYTTNTSPVVYNQITETFEATENLGTAFAANVRTAGIGALTSFLTAELAESVGINSTSFGGQLFSYVASQGINKLASFAIANVGEGLGFTEGLGGSLFGTVDGVLSTPVLSVANLAAFAGSYLARQIVSVENIGGAIGQIVGGAVGTAIGISAIPLAIGVLGPAAIIAVPLIAAFGGTALGTWVGNFLGSLFADDGWAKATVSIADNAASPVKSTVSTDDWDWGKPVQSMQNEIFEFLDVIMDMVVATGSGVRTTAPLQVYVYYANDNKPRIGITNAPRGTDLDALRGLKMTPDAISGFRRPRFKDLYGNTVLATYSWTEFESADGTKLVNWAITTAAKRLRFDGGDIFIRRALSASDATTAADLALQVRWGQTYGALSQILESYTGNKVAFTRANFNDAVGTQADATWRMARKMVSEMTAANKAQIGPYVANALATTSTTDLRLLIAQVTIAAQYGDVLDAVKSAVGGSWSGLVTPDFDSLDFVKGATETPAAYSARLSQTGVRAAIAAAAKATTSGDEYAFEAVKKSNATNAQVLMNQITVALSFSGAVAGQDTATTSDDSDLISSLGDLGVTLKSVTKPNFNTVTFSDKPPTVMENSTFQRKVVDAAEDLLITSLKSSTMEGDANVIAAIKTTAATSIAQLFKQLSVARTVSAILDDERAGFKKLLADLGVTVVTLPAIDYDQAVVTATTDAGYRSEVITEAKRLATAALRTATYTGDPALIAALKTNPDLTMRIVETAGGMINGFMEQTLAGGGQLLGLGPVDFGRVNWRDVYSKTGTDLDAAITAAAKVVAFDAVKDARFSGLELYTLRMLTNSVANTLDTLAGDFVILQDFKRYLDNRATIDAIAATDPNSAFAAGWNLTKLQAFEGLKLATVSATDFSEGFAQFLTRMDLSSYKAKLADLAVSVSSDGKILIDLPGDEDLAIARPMAGLVAVATGAAGASVTGSASRDLWVAADGAGSTFTEFATASSASHDVLLGGTGADTIDAGAGNDYLSGRSGHDRLTGGAGHDVLDGGVGNDIMIGGAGNDTYILDSTLDTIVEVDGEGDDTIYAKLTTVLPDHVERLVLFGTGAINGVGNVLNNTLIGNTADNVLVGGAGNDILVGGAGNDTLRGSSGNDTYVFGIGSGSDVIDNVSVLAADLDALVLDNTVARNAVWLQRAGLDLKLSILGTDDSVLVKDWYGTGQRALDEITLASAGTKLRADDVGALVNAMAAFSPAAIVQSAGTSSLVLPAAVQTAINASWRA